MSVKISMAFSSPEAIILILSMFAFFSDKNFETFATMPGRSFPMVVSNTGFFSPFCLPAAYGSMVTSKPISLPISIS